MDSEIKELINEYEGYVGTLFNFSLYVTKKMTRRQNEDEAWGSVYRNE